MSRDNRDRDWIEEQREQIGGKFNNETDPLEKYVNNFESLDVDPLQLYVHDVVESRGLSRSRINDFKRVYSQFRDFMEGRRPPACPTPWQIRQFAAHQKEKRGKKAQQVKADLWMLNNAYEYWQSQPEFPHPPDYNPIDNALEKIPFTDYSSEESDKEVRILPHEDLRQRVQKINHIRDQAIVGTQLKIGARVGEITEMRLCDINIQHSQLRDHYSELGTHPRLDFENAIIIPDKHERDGNKSSNYRILPIDDELRKLLIKYLLIRPDNDESYVFLSQERNARLWPKRINEMWKDAFHPEYAETENHKPVTSHYGRHYFTNYWRVKQEVDRVLVQYMRGDELTDDEDEKEGIDHYLHAKYPDIEELYRKNIYKFGI